MGFMGRKYDGGYAEKALIPRSNVFPIESPIDWVSFGALPETYLTSWGAIHEAIALPKNSSLLVRGGTSAAGLAAISIAKDMGCTVFATTRSEKKRAVLEQAGVHHILMETGETLAPQVKAILPQGVAGVIEFVGIERTIKDCLQCTAPKGTVCMVGFLGDTWDYKFFPWMPSTVKLTIYSSETIHADTQTAALQEIVDKVHEGIYSSNIHQVFDFKQLLEAHKIMENNQAAGKLVVKTF